MEIAYDGTGRPLRNLGAEGFTSTILEPLRVSQALRYPLGVCPAGFSSEAGKDNPGQNGSGAYTLENGTLGANQYGGKIDSNRGWWGYDLTCEIVELEVDANFNVTGNLGAIDGDLAARIAQNCQVYWNADGQTYDLGKLTAFLANWRGGSTANQSQTSFDRKWGWPGLADGKVPFSLNPGNSFSITVTTVHEDDIAGDPAENRLFVLRWTMHGVQWLQGGAAQKR